MLYMSLLILVGGGAVAFFVWYTLRQAVERRGPVAPVSERWLFEQRRGGEH